MSPSKPWPSEQEFRACPLDPEVEKRLLEGLARLGRFPGAAWARQMDDEIDLLYRRRHQLAASSAEGADAMRAECERCLRALQEVRAAQMHDFFERHRLLPRGAVDKALALAGELAAEVRRNSHRRRP